MKFFKKLYFILIVIVLCSIFPTYAYAESTGQVGYDIQAIIPENQIDKNKSFFDLKMEPSQKQVIEIMINNTSNKDSSFKVSVNQAYTNNQGFIDYSKNDIEPDESMKYKMSDIAKVEEEVVVSANSSRKVPITLEMPEEKFYGQILSGIQVEKKIDDDGEGKITNSYGYILGLKLTETDVEIRRQLNLKSIEPAVSFNRTSVVALLQNPTMDAYGHLKYKAKVTNNADDKVVREVSYDNDMQIAPNSTYGFAIDWDNERLEEGNYRLDLEVSDAKDNVWRFSEDFTITAKDAKEINKLTIDNTNKLPLWVWIVIIIFIILLISQFLIILFIKKRKKEQDEKLNNK